MARGSFGGPYFFEGEGGLLRAREARPLSLAICGFGSTDASRLVEDARFGEEPFHARVHAGWSVERLQKQFPLLAARADLIALSENIACGAQGLIQNELNDSRVPLARRFLKKPLCVERNAHI